MGQALSLCSSNDEGDIHCLRRPMRCILSSCHFFAAQSTHGTPPMRQVAKGLSEERSGKMAGRFGNEGPHMPTRLTAEDFITMRVIGRGSSAKVHERASIPSKCHFHNSSSTPPLLLLNTNESPVLPSLPRRFIRWSRPPQVKSTR